MATWQRLAYKNSGISKGSGAIVPLCDLVLALIDTTDKKLSIEKCEQFHPDVKTDPYVGAHLGFEKTDEYVRVVSMTRFNSMFNTFKSTNRKTKKLNKKHIHNKMITGFDGISYYDAKDFISYSQHIDESWTKLITDDLMNIVYYYNGERQIREGGCGYSLGHGYFQSNPCHIQATMDENNLTGKWYANKNYILFEKQQDAFMYKLLHKTLEFDHMLNPIKDEPISKKVKEYMGKSTDAVDFHVINPPPRYAFIRSNNRPK